MITTAEQQPTAPARGPSRGRRRGRGEPGAGPPHPPPILSARHTRRARSTVGTGCGLELTRFLKPDDVVELAVEKIGVLRNRIVRR